MQILTKAEAAEWLRRRGLNANGFREKEYSHRHSCHISEDTGKKTSLGKSLAAFLRASPEILLWITEFAVWPSSECMALFDGYRRSLGEVRQLTEAPAHAFSSEDGEALECVLTMALYFFWSVLLLDPSRHVLINVSHDEMVDIYSDDSKFVAELKAIFTSHGSI